MSHLAVAKLLNVDCDFFLQATGHSKHAIGGFILVTDHLRHALLRIAKIWRNGVVRRRCEEAFECCCVLPAMAV